MSPSFKGNYLSHYHCILHAVNIGLPVIICEDDVRFGPSSFMWIERVLEHLKGRQWDVLLTDVCVSVSNDMVPLFKLRKRCKERGVVELINPVRWRVPFAGAACYIVNPSSCPKILSHLNAEVLDIPFDLVLRQLLFMGHLNGLITFPFLSTLNEEGDNSQAQAHVEDEVVHLQNRYWNDFRRLVWIDADNEIDDLQSRVMGYSTLNPVASDVNVMGQIYTGLTQLQLGWGNDPSDSVPFRSDIISACQTGGER